MQLLEYQAKELLSASGATIPSGFIIRPDDSLGDLPFDFPAVLKSQVPVGGRGKLGGVRLVSSTDELEKNRREIEKLDIKGHLPEAVLVEQALEIKRELYLSLRLNRDKRRVEFLVSSDGGVDIETAVGTVEVVLPGETDHALKIAKILEIQPNEVELLVSQLERCFYDNDLLLLEINPLVETTGGELICADAKIMVDDNARFRQPDLSWKDESAIKPLGGTIGVIANGAGMAMSTMDTIYAAGGQPANFLDIGGGTGEDIFVKNLRGISELPGVSSIIINIFAGITRCDDIARGIIAAKAQIPNLVPLFIRLEGTRRDEAAELLDKAGISMEPDLKSCVKEAMELESWQAGKLVSEKARAESQGISNIEYTAARSLKLGSKVASDRSLILREGTKGVVQPDDNLTETVLSPARNGVLEQDGRRGSEARKTTLYEEALSESHDGERILLSSRVIVQGITGHHGSFHTEHMLAAGTQIVGGVTPGKDGQTIHGVPVFDSVKQATESTGATASVIFVPARFAKSAALEAMGAGIKLIVIITEGIPVHDMLAIHQKAAGSAVTVVGPNCPGFIVPGSHKLGIIASHITKPGHTTVISRSGTLTYELADALSKKGIGQRLILGIGGDPVQGMDFIEALKIAEADPETKQIIMIGEIGGEGENLAADFIEKHVKKPVYGLVVGHSLPPGQTFGHAGAIVGSKGESAAEKSAYMMKKGLMVSETLDQLIDKLT